MFALVLPVASVQSVLKACWDFILSGRQELVHASCGLGTEFPALAPGGNFSALGSGLLTFHRHCSIVDRSYKREISACHLSWLVLRQPDAS